MFLSDYLNKSVLVAKQPRGVCLGIGFSLKNQAIKCLLCAPTSQQKPSFAVSFSAVDSVTEHVALRRLRSVLPTGCARITIGMPVYTYEGDFLGYVTDAEIQDGEITLIFTDRHKPFHAATIFACNDALILRKKLPYPLGQRVPAPVLLQIKDKTDGFVTRPLLRAAMEKRSLIKLTLSLPPFNLSN